jgi:hypothetical protein
MFHDLRYRVMHLVEVVTFSMKHECTAIERTQKSCIWKSSCAGDDVLVKERMTVIPIDPHVEPLVEVLQVIAQSPNRPEIQGAELVKLRKKRVAPRARSRVQDLVDIRRVQDEMMKVKEHVSNMRPTLCFDES